MRHAGSQQCQRLDALAFNGLKRLLTRFRRVVQNQRHAGTPRGFAVQRRRIQTQEAVPRIIHFKLVPNDLLPSGAVPRRQLFPIQIRQIPPHRLSLGILRLQPEQICDRQIEIDDTSLLIDHEHSVLDRVEQGLQKASFARQALNDGLQTFRIEPANAPEDLVEKAGFGGGHQNHFFFLKYQ